MNDYNNILKGKKLLLLGSTRNDLEFVKSCKEMGVFIGVTDWNKLENAPAKKVADKYYDISIADLEALDKIIKEDKYDGVIAGFSDSYLNYYEAICKYSGLNCYATKEQIELLTNKTKYKKLLKEYNVPTLRQYKVDEINKDFDKFPLMLKPAEGSGGKGLTVAKKYDDFINVINGYNNTDGLVIERYIEERLELTAFFLFVDGEVTLLGTANRFLSKKQGDKVGLPILYTMPSSFDEQFKNENYPNMKKMFEDIGLKNGILFAQCMIVDDEINVYDIGYRVTGTMEFKLFNKMYGIDTLKMLISHALIGDMNPLKLDIKALMNKQSYGYNVTIQGKPGIVKEIHGAQELMQDEEIIDVAIKTAVGSEITEKMLGTLEQIVARIFYTSETLENGLNKLDKIYETIKVINQDDEDMILERIKNEDILDLYR